MTLRVSFTRFADDSSVSIIVNDQLIHSLRVGDLVDYSCVDLDLESFIPKELDHGSHQEENA